MVRRAPRSIPSHYLAAVPTHSRLRGWLELLRLPNLPTAASNALLGAWLGLAAVGHVPGFPGSRWLGAAAEDVAPTIAEDLLLLARVTAGICGLYLVGLILNDVLDLETDRRERPARPLPSGRVRVRHAAAAAAAIGLGSLWLVGALGGSTPVAVLSLLLCGAILLYDLLHARFRWTVVLPGACRGLAIILAAVATAEGVRPAQENGAASSPIPWLDPIVLASAGVVAVFVVAVSLVARGEVRTEEGRLAMRRDLGAGPHWVVGCGLLCLVPAATLGAMVPRATIEDPLGTMQLLRDLAVLGCLAGWFVAATRWTDQTPVPRLVGGWLGSLCLIDAVVLAAIGPTPMIVALILFAASRLLGRRLAAS